MFDNNSHVDPHENLVDIAKKSIKNIYNDNSVSSVKVLNSFYKVQSQLNKLKKKVLSTTYD